MRAVCVSDQYCPYKTDTGYCGYTGNGCRMDNISTLTLPTSYEITKLVELSPDSINQIADAVVERLADRLNRKG